MTDARQSGFWHRTRLLVAIAAVAIGAATQSAACSDGGESPTGTGPGGGTPTSNSSSGTGATGGVGGTGGTGGSGLVFDMGIDAPSPLDATPDLEGETIYFTAVGPNGAGVFTGTSGGVAKELKVGDPFVSPFGIAIGSDGTQLYIADPAADAGQDRGVIFVLPIAGGNPTQLSGTANTVPRGVELRMDAGTDTLYFTGNDLATGAAGAFSIPATGGALKQVNKTGVAFRDPSGIALHSDGRVFVADTISTLSGTADIVVIDKAGDAKVLVGDLQVGYPAGVALSLDETWLFVSGFDPATRTDRLIQVHLATKQTTLMFEAEIGKFNEAAGLHRAKKVQAFAWADSTAGPMGGKVFVIK